MNGVTGQVGANDKQVGGVHYQGQSKTGRQHWDVVDEFNLDYFQGQITKYVMRWRLKNGIQDLEKARHFLDKYIEIERTRMGGKKLTGALTNGEVVDKMSAGWKNAQAAQAAQEAQSRAARFPPINGPQPYPTLHGAAAQQEGHPGAEYVNQDRPRQDRPMRRGEDPDR